MAHKARVLLADDHKIVIEGLRSLLESEFELVATVDNGRKLVSAAAQLHPDVIVTDISMPLLNGLEAARQIKRNDPDARIIFLTMHRDVTYATRAFGSGASGYVLKHSALSELLAAIREVLKGRTYVTPRIANEVLRALISGAKTSSADTVLTERQREVLQLVAEGRSAKDIATVLYISPRTVEFHKYRTMDILGLHSHAELVQYAVTHCMAPEAVRGLDC